MWRRIKARKDRSEEASDLNHARRLVELDPENAEAHALLSLRYANERLWTSSERHASLAVDLDPHSAAAHYAASVALFDGRTWRTALGMQRLKKAASFAEKAVELEPYNPGYRFNIARIYMAMVRWGRWSRLGFGKRSPLLGLARDNLEYSLSHRPDNVLYLFFLARCVEMMGDVGAAEAYFRRMNVMAPDEPLVSLGHAAFLARRFRFLAARRLGRQGRMLVRQRRSHGCPAPESR